MKFDKPVRILDIGCGPGTWIMVMLPLCSRRLESDEINSHKKVVRMWLPNSQTASLSGLICALCFRQISAPLTSHSSTATFLKDFLLKTSHSISSTWDSSCWRWSEINGPSSWKRYIVSWNQEVASNHWKAEWWYIFLLLHLQEKG